MTRRRSPSRAPEQFSLPEQPPASPEKSKRAMPTPEQIAKGSIARRAKPSAVPGNVILNIRLDLKRDLAERLSARAVREGVNIEAIMADLLREELGP